MTVGNPLLDDVVAAPHMKHGRNVLLHSETARQKGLADGDEVWVETTHGARVSRRRHGDERPSSIPVVGFPGLFGRWAHNLPRRAYGGAHFNALLPRSLERIDKVAATTDMCVKAKVYRAAH